MQTIQSKMQNINCVDALRDLCVEVSNQSPTNHVKKPTPLTQSFSNGVCHLCGGFVDSTNGCFSPIVQNKSFVAHVSCYELRICNSVEHNFLAMKLGFWAMTRARHFGSTRLPSESKHRDWVGNFLDEYSASIGNKALSFLPNITPKVQIEDTLSCKTTIQRVIRHSYVDERELLKSEYWVNFGCEIRPEWDGAEDWKAYENKHHEWYWDKSTVQARHSANKERSKHRLSNKEKKLLPVITANRCHLCFGGGDSFAADHVVPFCRGGSHEFTNYLPAHSWCNVARGQVGPTEINLAVCMGKWLIDLVSRIELTYPWVERLAVKYSVL
jgi:hypothetical protein